MSKTKYIMIRISGNLGSDMSGTYFIQETGNKDAINKFLMINTNGDVQYYPKKYTYDQVISLKEFEHLFDAGHADNVEVLMLSGKLTVPGRNKEYSQDELGDWWQKYLDCTKFPVWSNIAEEVIDLNIV